MPSRYQTGIGGKLGPQAAAGSSGPYVGQPPINPATATPQYITPASVGSAALNNLGRAAVLYGLYDTGKKVLNPDYNITHGLRNLVTSVGNAFGGDGEYVGESPLVDNLNIARIRAKQIKQAGGIEKYKKLYPDSVRGGYAPSYKVTRTKADIEPEVETQTPPPPPAPAPAAETGAARLDPNATKDYKAAFGAGQKKMDDMLEYFGSQNNGENLKTWAKANPALAWKEYKKAGMAGKEPFGYDEVVYGKLQDNPAKNIKELGIDKLYDGQAEDTRTSQEKFAQAFLGDAIKGLTFGKYKDLGNNPLQIDPGTLLDQSVDFNIPGLERPLGNYGIDDYANLLKDSHIIYN